MLKDARETWDTCWCWNVGVGLLNCTANDYRQTTDKLIFKHVTSTLR